MTVNLLKRLESSVEAFRLTLNRLAGTVAEAIQAVDDHAGSSPTSTSAFTDIDADDDDFEFPTSGTVGKKVQIDLADMDVESWQARPRPRRRRHRRPSRGDQPVTPEHDLKLPPSRARIRGSSRPRSTPATARC